MVHQDIRFLRIILWEKSKYNNYSREDFITELEANNKQIHSLNSSMNSLNSKLWMQKQISLILGIILSIIVLATIIKTFLSKYKEKIRKKLMAELNSKQEMEDK
jgi:hypothetical protein